MPPSTSSGWRRPQVSASSGRRGGSMGTGRRTWRSPAPRAPSGTRGSWRGRSSTILSADLPPHVTGVEVAGPGFVNFHLAPTWLHDVLADVVEQGEAGLRAGRPGARRAGDDRVRVGEPDRADPCRERVVRLVRGQPRARDDPVWVRRQPRVLRERHRRADPGARGVRAGAAGRGAAARGGVPEWVREGPGQRLRRAGRHRRGRSVGGRAHPRVHPGADGRRQHHASTPGSARPPSRTARLSRRRSPTSSTRASCGRRKGRSGSTPSASATRGRSGWCASRPSRAATSPTWPATSPTTATSSSNGASTGSSTCGGRTTRARCPACWPGSRRSGSSAAGWRSASGRWCRWPGGGSASGSATPSTSTTSSTTSGPT